MGRSVRSCSVSCAEETERSVSCAEATERSVICAEVTKSSVSCAEVVSAQCPLHREPKQNAARAIHTDTRPHLTHNPATDSPACPRPSMAQTMKRNTGDKREQKKLERNNAA